MVQELGRAEFIYTGDGYKLKKVKRSIQESFTEIKYQCREIMKMLRTDMLCVQKVWKLLLLMCMEVSKYDTY